MSNHVLAGDIGGTKTNLALYECAKDRVISLVSEKTFASREYDGLEEVLEVFCRAEHAVDSAAFGIAGPVIDGVVMTTNLPWRVERKAIGDVLGCDRVRLMNDLETTAYGALFLSPQDVQVLHQGQPRRGNAAVIAAGTGLGQALLYWDGTRHLPTATEGGHADFAPRDDVECELLGFLKKKYHRVSYERVLSGPGLYNLFQFFDQVLKTPVSEVVRARLKQEDPGAVVGEAGVSGACAACQAAVELFVSLYGAQAGNLALATLAVGGVYVGGGIVTKMLAKVNEGSFLHSFQDKGRYGQMMSEIPVTILLSSKTSLVGAAQAALDLLE